MTAIVTTGDVRALPLPDESVDLVVTSPPYYRMRRYAPDALDRVAIGEEANPRAYVAALVEATAELVRVLKPTGSIFVNLGDKYARVGGVERRARGFAGDVGHRGAPRPASRDLGGVPEKSLMLLPERYRIACTDELGLIARATVVWSKPNGLPESVRDRVRRAHEDWVHLTRTTRYFEDVDALRRPSTTDRAPSRLAKRPGAGKREQRVAWDGVGDPRGPWPGSVWSVPVVPLRVPAAVVHATCCGGDPRPGCTDGLDHFAAFPPEWPRRIISGWCPPGGVVLDPFGGTGTTALVADILERVGISVDSAPGYVPLAQWRTTDPRERERAGERRPRRPRPRRGLRPADPAPGLFDIPGGESA